MHKMRWWQIMAARRGLARQDRAAWESTRLLIFSLQCMLGGDNAPRSVHDVIRFGYEKPVEAQPIAEMTAEKEAELKKLLASCRAHNEKVAG